MWEREKWELCVLKILETTLSSAVLTSLKHRYVIDGRNRVSQATEKFMINGCGIRRNNREIFEIVTELRRSEERMSGNLRREALRVFKKLHRTRLNTFKGDDFALDLTRLKINEEFQKHKNVSDEAAITEHIKFAEAVEHEIRTTVIQAVEKEPGTYALRITDDTVKVSNEVVPGAYIPKEKLKKCTDSPKIGRKADS